MTSPTTTMSLKLCVSKLPIICMTLNKTASAQTSTSFGGSGGILMAPPFITHSSLTSWIKFPWWLFPLHSLRWPIPLTSSSWHSVLSHCPLCSFHFWFPIILRALNTISLLRTNEFLKVRLFSPPQCFYTQLPTWHLNWALIRHFKLTMYENKLLLLAQTCSFSWLPHLVFPIFLALQAPHLRII